MKMAGYPFINIPNEKTKYADSEIPRDKFRGDILAMLSNG